jgi:hypothetical protein
MQVLLNNHIMKVSVIPVKVPVQHFKINSHIHGEVKNLLLMLGIEPQMVWTIHYT